MLVAQKAKKIAQDRAELEAAHQRELEDIIRKKELADLEAERVESRAETTSTPASADACRPTRAIVEPTQRRKELEAYIKKATAFAQMCALSAAIISSLASLVMWRQARVFATVGTLLAAVGLGYVSQVGKLDLEATA